MNRFYIDRWKKMNRVYVFRVHFNLDLNRFRRKKCLKLHHQLKKIESYLTIQIRIEKNDLTNFFHRLKIFDVKSIFCRCDWSKQTIKLVIMFCSLMNNRNQFFKNIDINDYHVVTHLNKRFKMIIKCLLQHDLLKYFSLIIKLLYKL
jgi:hypothetical protein